MHHGCDMRRDRRPAAGFAHLQETHNGDAFRGKPEMFYIPEKFAHGFITLEDKTEVFYQMSEFYSQESARGFRWNDPFFGIRLPLDVTVISERDRDYPDFRPQT